MKRLLFAVAMLLTLALVAAILLLVAALQRAPLVNRDESISAQSIAEARSLFASNDPRRLNSGEESTVAIPATLIDAGIDYLAGRKMHGRGAFRMVRDGAEIDLSWAVLTPGAPRYLNLRAKLQATAGEVRVVAASLGPLAIPPMLAEWLVGATVYAAGVMGPWQSAVHAIRKVNFAPLRQTVDITYVWQAGLLDQARALAFTAEDIACIGVAQHALVALLAHQSPREPVSLAKVLTSLLSNAGQNTPRQRRAALLVLASHLTGKSLTTVLPQARHWPRPRAVSVTLRHRHDSAQHFIVSAALAAWAGEPVANAIGLYKELADSRGGSGFSFADLAADRAGTRFGELVAGGSVRLDEALRQHLDEGDIAPGLADLPEFLSEAEFTRRFQDRDSAAFRHLGDEIERRLADLPLYR